MFCEGPSNWATAYAAANGKNQSPIDIIKDESIFNQKLTEVPLKFTYDENCFAYIENTGYSFNVSGRPGAYSSLK